MDSHQGVPVKRWRRIAVIVWAVTTLCVLLPLFAYFREYNLSMYRNISLVMLVQSFPVMFLAFMLTRKLLQYPIFRWRPANLFIKTKSVTTGAAVGGSLMVNAMKARFVGILVTIMMLLNLPIIATLEEFIFREGTADWTDAVWRSALFGLAHFATNLPLGAALSIGLVGMWFSHWYLLGGIELSSVAHFSYILLILGLVSPQILIGHFRRK
ncbi:hypothetical protein ACFLZO_01090 [Patescibacteria group bacterium]